ncbi:MAG: hypothetical protein Q4F95_03725 [Oscillospiraceae bacterium]|nr:hypothetical protein [Oscillospiraceae bacterium]
MKKSEMYKMAAEMTRDITVAKMTSSNSSANSDYGECVGEFYVAVFKMITEELQKSDMCDEADDNIGDFLS